MVAHIGHGPPRVTGYTVEISPQGRIHPQSAGFVQGKRRITPILQTSRLPTAARMDRVGWLVTVTTASRGAVQYRGVDHHVADRVVVPTDTLDARRGCAT